LISYLLIGIHRILVGDELFRHGNGLLSQKIKTVQIEDDFDLHRHDSMRFNLKTDRQPIWVRQYKPGEI